MSRAKRILVVDDNRSVVRILELVLQREGYEVLTAFNGLDALQQAIEQLPDLIILDIVMPKMNGYEVCHYLHKKPDTADIPIVILTVKGKVDGLDADLENKRLLDQRVLERTTGFDAGAVDFLSKPIIAKEVVAQVKKLLDFVEQD